MLIQALFYDKYLDIQRKYANFFTFHMIDRGGKNVGNDDSIYSHLRISLDNVFGLKRWGSHCVVALFPRIGSSDRVIVSISCRNPVI